MAKSKRNRRTRPVSYRNYIHRQRSHTKSSLQRLSYQNTRPLSLLGRSLSLPRHEPLGYHRGYMLEGYNANLNTPKLTQRNVFNTTMIPRKFMVCMRRKIRREVIFARNLRTKGSGASRRRLTMDSQINCRR